MENNKAVFIIIGIAGVASLIWFFFFRTHVVVAPAITSFETCVEAGLPVSGQNPRQCKTSDGRTFAEEIIPEITYKNSSADLVVVSLPYPGAVSGKVFSVTGKARGSWYFEGSFPIQVLDKNGKVLASVPAKANGEWMTSEFVPFTAEISIPESYTGEATLVLIKDNPSDMRQYDASVSFPITIEY